MKLKKLAAALLSAVLCFSCVTMANAQDPAGYVLTSGETSISPRMSYISTVSMDHGYSNGSCWASCGVFGYAGTTTKLVMKAHMQYQLPNGSYTTWTTFYNTVNSYTGSVGGSANAPSGKTWRLMLEVTAYSNSSSSGPQYFYQD